MTVRILKGDCREILRSLEDESVHCVVTSPPYFGLRNYGMDGQLGQEPTPSAFVSELVGVFSEIRRVLRTDGTVWLNLGDSYVTSPPGRGPTPGSSTLVSINNPKYQDTLASGHSTHKGTLGALSDGLKQKDLIGIPWRVAFALQADGWYLRQDIIWSKSCCMPESIRDRCTKSHEYIFLLSKRDRYYFDQKAIAEPALYAESGRSSAGKSDISDQRKRNGSDGLAASFRAITETRNKRSVWEVAPAAFPEAHFATFPPALIEPCILAGCPKGGAVLDPFGGAGTTGLVADRLGRNALLIELNPEYAEIAHRRIHADAGMFADVQR